MTAKTIRGKAWSKLGENGGWTAAICGALLAFLASYVINAAVQGVFGVTDFIDLMNKVQLRQAQPEELLQAFPRHMLSLSVATLIAYYISAVFKYGISALSIAVMRSGARIGHVFSGFGKGWSTLWMMALADFYVFCWSLLFLIPGICAAFSYALIFLVKADHPDWDANRCIGESKRLMKGNRWRYLCFMLSFLGWSLLGIVTLGLAFIFVIPYFNTAQAAFYEDILDSQNPAENPNGNRN